MGYARPTDDTAGTQRIGRGHAEPGTGGDLSGRGRGGADDGGGAVRPAGNGPVASKPLRGPILRAPGVHRRPVPAARVPFLRDQLRDLYGWGAVASGPGKS